MAGSPVVDVLIVDSDEVFTDILASGLQSEFTSIRAAVDAQSAVDALDERSADVIVLEVVLDQNNGLTLLQHLQSYADWQQIPVVVLTKLPADRLSMTDEQWRQYGVIECIRKSELELNQLQQLIIDTAAHAARTN